MLAPKLARRRLVLELLENRTLLASDIISSIVNGSPQYDIFLSLDGIPGSSADADHKGTIQIESFSWGASNTGSVLRPGRNVAQDLHFLAPIDKASPLLFGAAADGRHISKAILFVRKAGDSGNDFLKVTLSDVLVSSLQSESLNGEVPEEEVTLRFAALEESFRPQDPNGSLGQAITNSWQVPTSALRQPGPSLLEQQHKLDPGTTAGAVDMFLKLDGIDGDSTDATLPGTVEVESFSWGLSQSPVAQGSGGGAGRLGSLSMQDFHFVSTANKASPLLMDRLAKGQHIAKATLYVRKAGERTEFMQIKLEDVLVSSYHVQSTNQTLPMDEVSLNFTRQTQTFTPTDDKGNPTTPTEGQWSNSLRPAAYAVGPGVLDLSAPSTSQAALFIKFDGIDGESADVDHKGSVELASFSWGLSRSIPTRGTANDAFGAVTLEDLHVAAAVSSASPTLMAMCATGKHIPSAKLFVREAATTNLDYLKYELKDTLISSYALQSSGESLPLEEVSLNFTQVAQTFTPQDPKSGDPQSSIVDRIVTRKSTPYALGDSVLDETNSQTGQVGTWIKFDGIAGDSTNINHAGEVELGSFRWGLRRTDLTTAAGRVTASPKLTSEEFQGLTALDRSAPLLFSSAALGKHIVSAVLSVDRSGAAAKGELNFLKIKLSDVLVSSFQVQSTDDGTPAESFSLNFTRLEHAYTPQSQNGQAATPIQSTLQIAKTPLKFEPGAKLSDPRGTSAHALDAFLKIGDVAGESTNTDHKGEIEILSFSWGVSNPSSQRTSGGGGGAGRPVLQDLHFVTPVSVATPALLKLATDGTHAPQSLLTLRTKGNTPVDFFTVKLSDVLVSSYQLNGGSDLLPTEELSLNFTRVEFQYSPPSIVGAVASPIVSSFFDITQARPTYKIGDYLTSQTTPIQAPYFLYLKLDGIAGDSTAANHKGEVDVESFSWGMSRPVTSRSSKSGGGSGKVTFSDLHFTIPAGSASPLLFGKVATGQHIPSAILSIDRRLTEGPPVSYYTVKLSDVLVSSYQHQSSNSVMPTDQLSLNFAKIAVESSSQASTSAAIVSDAASTDELFATWGT